MRRPVDTRPLAGALLGLALLAAPAGAQDLGAYRSVTGALDAAVRERASDQVRSLADVDRAIAAFGTLEPTLESRVIAGGARDALTNARIAVGRSQTDLEAQVAQARGLLRRALYEQTLGAIAPGPVNQANQARVGLLADEFGVRGAARAALLQAAARGNADAVAARLDQAAARQIQASLARAAGAGQSGAYLELARATGTFTVVQDSPRVGNLRLDNFLTALKQLTGRDGAGFKTTLKDLQAGADAFETASSAALGGQPLPPPASRGQGGTNAGTTGQGGAAVTPPASTGGPAVPPAPGVVPQGSGAVQGGLLAALAAAGHGDGAGASAALAQAEAALNTLPAGLRAAADFPAFSADLAAAKSRPGLRPADVRALIGALHNLSGPASALDRASAGVQRVWGGGLGALVWLLLGLLAVVPLYLLNLAFGGRNPYWRAIAAAFTLLLLPAMLEGLAGLGSWLGGVSGVGLLGALANLSLLQSPLAGPLWALSVALAVGLGIYGFRGICQQFGLLGGARPNQTQITQPAVEWDEEL